MLVFDAVSNRFGKPLALAFLAVTAAWIILIVALPISSMVYESFRPNLLPSEFGGPKDRLTLENYSNLLQSDVHRNVFLRTIWGSAIVTLISLCVCYPIAFALAKQSGAHKMRVVILLLMVPFWLSEVLRTYTWFLILAFNGVLNSILIWLGVIDEPIRWMQGSSAVIVGMVYAFILLMIFPLLASLSTLDNSLLEAAHDMGASVYQTHRKVVLPHCAPGIASGCILVFVSAASSYAAPAILGAPGTRWFTQVILTWFFNGQNWPQGAAYAMALLLLCLFVILLALYLVRICVREVSE